MHRYLKWGLRFTCIYIYTDKNANVIPPDHMGVKMQLQHIVLLNCRSAPLKIGHTAESSGGCGTWQGKKGFHRKAAEKRDPSQAPAERWCKQQHRGTNFQNAGGEKNGSVNKAVLKTPSCPSNRLNLNGWRRPIQVSVGCRSNAIFNLLPKMRFYKAVSEYEHRARVHFFFPSDAVWIKGMLNDGFENRVRFHTAANWGIAVDFWRRGTSTKRHSARKYGEQAAFH